MRGPVGFTGMLRRRAPQSSIVLSHLARLLSASMQALPFSSPASLQPASRGGRPSSAAAPAAYHSRAARYSRKSQVAKLDEDQQQQQHRLQQQRQRERRRQQVPADSGLAGGTAGGGSLGGDASSSGTGAAPPRMALASSAHLNSCVYNTGELASTWLLHWRQQEERLQFRRAVLHATRGRQMLRRRQLSALVAAAQPAAAAEAAAEAEEAAVAALAAALAAAEQQLGQRQRQREGWQPGGAARAAVDAAGALAGRWRQGAAAAAAAGGRRIEAGAWGRMGDLEWLYGLPGEAEAGEEVPDWVPPQAEGEGAAAAAGSLGPQRLRLQGQDVSIRPLWISVFQEEGSQDARLYESVVPLDDTVMAHLRTPLAPFCTAAGLRFGDGDAREGAWRNYLVGVVGAVGAVEEEALWPNQILHRDRLMHNVRDALDVARFLALPSRADIETHLGNLRRIAAERGWRPGWCWHMLRQRWGEAALREHGIQVGPGSGGRG